MKFVEEVEKLQNANENEGYLIFVRCGIFYTAIGNYTSQVFANINLNDIIFVYGKLEGDKLKIVDFALM